MTARWFVAAALLVGLAATAPNADETSARVFHIGIVAGTPRSSPERVAFEDRLRELGYVEGRNLAIDFVQYTNLDRGAAAVGERQSHISDHRDQCILSNAARSSMLRKWRRTRARARPSFMIAHSNGSRRKLRRR